MYGPLIHRSLIRTNVCVTPEVKEMFRGIQATNGQGLDYLWEKYADQIRDLVLQSAGGDIKDYMTADKHIRVLVGLICTSRWLSVERQCHLLVRLLNARASQDLIDFCKKGHTNEQWDDLVQLCE